MYNQSSYPNYKDPLAGIYKDLGIRTSIPIGISGTSAQTNNYTTNNYAYYNNPEQVTKVQKLERLVTECRYFYTESKLDQAYKIYLECKQIKAEAKGSELAKIEVIFEKEKKLFETVESEYKYMEKILKELDCEGEGEEWTADSVGETSKLYYRHVAETSSLSLRMEMDLDVSIETMITLIYEIKLWDHWAPFIKSTDEIKKINRSAAVYYVEFGLPYPLAVRECHLSGFGVNRLYENGSILILSRSVDKDEEFLERHYIKKVDTSGAVAMDMHFGGFELTPNGKDKCKLRGICNINPNFYWLPNSLINFLFKKGMQYILDRLVDKAKHFEGSVWEEEVKKEEKRPFYTWLNKEIEAYHLSLLKQGK